MKKSEVLEMYEEKVKDALKEAYSDVCGNPRVQESVYIWDDGEIETLFAVSGDNSWLQPRSGEDRALYHVATIKGTDVDDYGEGTLSDEKEQAREEIIDWLIEEYDPYTDYDSALEAAKAEEKYRLEEENNEW